MQQHNAKIRNDCTSLEFDRLLGSGAMNRDPFVWYMFMKWFFCVILKQAVYNDVI